MRLGKAPVAVLLCGGQLLPQAHLPAGACGSRASGAAAPRSSSPAPAGPPRRDLQAVAPGGCHSSAEKTLPFQLSSRKLMVTYRISLNSLNTSVGFKLRRRLWRCSNPPAGMRLFPKTQLLQRGHDDGNALPGTGPCCNTGRGDRMTASEPIFGQNMPRSRVHSRGNALRCTLARVSGLRSLTSKPHGLRISIRSCADISDSAQSCMC